MNGKTIFDPANEYKVWVMAVTFAIVAYVASAIGMAAVAWSMNRFRWPLRLPVVVAAAAVAGALVGVGFRIFNESHDAEAIAASMLFGALAAIVEALVFCLLAGIGWFAQAQADRA